MENEIVWNLLPEELSYLKQPVSVAILQYHIYDDTKLVHLLQNISDEYYEELVTIGALIKTNGDSIKINAYFASSDHWDIDSECFYVSAFITLLDLLDIDID